MFGFNLPPVIADVIDVLLALYVNLAVRRQGGDVRVKPHTADCRNGRCL